MALPTSGALTLANIQTEFGGTNPIALGEYYAGGGLVPAGTSGTYGAVPSSGALSVQNFYGTTAFTPIYIEDVFSTYLYTGNGTSQTITNGIDLAGKGGLVWIKRRNGVYSHVLYDTSRGVNLSLSSNTTGVNANQAPDGVSAFNATGFSLNGNSHLDNNTTGTYASWTFRKQPKFFDVVTWTGDGSTNRQIAHSLNGTVGCIFVKSTTSAASWRVYHRSVGATGALTLNSTAVVATDSAAVKVDSAEVK